MNAPAVEMQELHWMLDMVQSIDAGLMVLDRDYRVVVWNSFMENHSGQRAAGVQGRNLFELFPEVPEAWFRRKAEAVFLLGTRSFTTWEQRPWLFRFRSYRPITGSTTEMFQNVTLNPLHGATGEVERLCIIVYDVTETATHKHDLEEANHELQRLSRTDRLTRLYNRGHWEERMRECFGRCQRYGVSATLVMFDIDHFKKVNDTWGHQAGDEVLRELSDRLKKSIRTTDVAGRYGGEEFGVVLTDTGLDGALFFVERFRKLVEKLVIRHGDEAIRFTISLGVAPYREMMMSPAVWIEEADKALYAAKHGGRNRHQVAGAD